MGQALPSPDIPKLIHALESRQRDGAGVVVVPPATVLGRIPFVHVRGLSAFWRGNDEPDPLHRMEDLLAALNGLAVAVHFLLLGHKGQVAFYVGLEHPQSAPLLRPLLASLFPGAHLAETTTNHIDAMLAQSHALAARGLLTGIPSRGRAGGAPPALSLIHI